MRVKAYPPPTMRALEAVRRATVSVRTEHPKPDFQYLGVSPDFRYRMVTDLNDGRYFTGANVTEVLGIPVYLDVDLVDAAFELVWLR
jgi:hypothetical protein